MKKMRPPFSILLAFASFSCAQLPKVNTPDASAETPRPTWLAAHTVFASEDFTLYESVLKPFPAKGSPEEAEDYKILYERQATRTKSDCDLAQLEAHADSESFIAKLSFKISKSDQEQLIPFLNKVRSDSDVITHHFKDQFARKRPPLQNSKLKPCIELPTSMSYPSGHASVGVVLAQTLEELYPKKKLEIEKRGHQFGEHRVMGGVHFPSDIQMGELIGQKIMDEVRKNPKYIAELKEVRLHLKSLKLESNSKH